MMAYFFENWIDHQRASPKKLRINVVNLLVIGKSITSITLMCMLFAIYNRYDTSGTYSKNSGRATVSPNLCALKNKVYKYGKSR